MGQRFAEHVVWITGGGSGIGRAMAVEFASQGAKVAVSGRREGALEAVTSQIAQSGGEALAVPCDVTREPDIEAAVAQVVDAWGRLDVCVANAGFAVGGRFERVTAEQWRRQLEVNVVGAAMTARHALPELHKTSGRVARVASVASMVAYPKGAPYAAS